MKTIKGHARVRGYTASDNQERYNLHRQLKRKGIVYNPYERKIFNSECGSKPVDELLLKFGYVIENPLVQ